MPYDLILIGIVSLAIAHFLEMIRERAEVGGVGKRGGDSC